MPDPASNTIDATTHKLVKVNDLGVIAFPSAMDDRHIASLIKSFREQNKAPNARYAKPGPYKTNLSPQEEQKFQQWVTANKVPWQDTPTADYDMRGYYKAMVSGDQNAKQSKNPNDNRMHFPDIWKTPYHKSFSNESRYALPTAPRWNDKDQLVDAQGKVVFDERNPTPAAPPPVQPRRIGGLATEQSEHARQLKVAPPQRPTPVPQGEGLYRMLPASNQGFSRTEDEIQVPFSQVQEKLAAGYHLHSDEAPRYEKDRTHQGQGPTLWERTKTGFENWSQPVANPMLTPGLMPIQNTNQLRAAARTVSAAPGYLGDVLAAAKDVAVGNDPHGQGLLPLLDPLQMPQGLYEQFRRDWTKSPKLAVDNLIGSLIGLGVVGAATHGAKVPLENASRVAATAIDTTGRAAYRAIKSPMMQRLLREESGHINLPEGQAPKTEYRPDLLEEIAEHTQTMNALRSHLMHSTPEQIRAFQNALEETGARAATTDPGLARRVAHADIAASKLLDEAVRQTNENAWRGNTPATQLDAAMRRTDENAWRARTTPAQPVDPGWVKRMVATAIAAVPERKPPVPAAPKPAPAQPVPALKQLRELAAQLNPQPVNALTNQDPKLVPPATLSQNIQSTPGYAYHATSEDRLHEIAQSGRLNIYGPSYGTDQSVWPDMGTEKRAYFTPRANTAWQFAPEEGRPVVVRTTDAALRRESTGDLYSRKAIPAQSLEYLGQDNQWHPVQSLAAPKVQPVNLRTNQQRAFVPTGNPIIDLRNRAFMHLGDQQRGAPENAMLQIQYHPLGPGVLSPIVEHVGDLTHRMTDRADIRTGFGYGNVKSKVDQTYSSLARGPGWMPFEEEVAQNQRNNYNYAVKNKGETRPFEQVQAELNALGEKYAQEHARLPVYNHVQELGRDAAVAVGRRQYDVARAKLKELKSILDKGEAAWVAEASKYDANYGKPQTPAAPQAAPAAPLQTPASPPEPQMPDIQMARNRQGKLTLGADPAALGKILGSSLYSGDTPKVVIKELLQNALDAVRDSKGEKKVTVEMNQDYDPVTGKYLKYIRVRDTGKGMTKHELETVFTDLGSSGKRELEEASGGFGLAKAALLMMTERSEVETIVKKRGGGWLRHSFTATPADLLGEGVDIKTEELPEWSQPPGRVGEGKGWQTGTTVKAVLSEDAGFYGARRFLETAMLSIRQPGELEITQNGSPIQRSSSPIPPLQPKPMISHEIPGAKLDLYVSDDKNPNSTPQYGQLDIEVHNNGIYQFGTWVMVPEGVRNLPARVAVDVRATVEEGDPDYPFLANRESLRSNTEEAIKDLVKEKITTALIQRHIEHVSHIYHNLPTIQGTNLPIFDSGTRLTPEEMAELQSNPAIMAIGESINQLSAYAIAILQNSSMGVDFSNLRNHIKRVGLVFSQELHGVYVTDPLNPTSATIFINPFTSEDDAPYETASLVWHTIKHELIHDEVKGHHETFTSAEAATSRALGRMEIDALMRLRDDYADPNDSERLRPEFNRAFQIYKDSRGRPESSPDIFGGEALHAEMAGRQAGPGSQPGVRAGGEDAVSGAKPDERGLIEPVNPLMNLGYKAADATQPFYLKSEKLLGEKMKGPMPAGDVEKMLLANGVKPEEMQWTGLADFLKEKGNAKVTPEEVKQFIAQNDLQIQEVQKGTGQPPQPQAYAAINEWGAGNGLSDDVENALAQIRRGEVQGGTGDLEMLGAPDDLLAPFRNYAQGEGGAKYGSWQLPGGTNYRELLVTMPNMGEAPARIAALQKDFATTLDKVADLRTKIEETGHQGPDADRLMQEFKTARNDAGKIQDQLNAWKVKRSEGVFRTNHWSEHDVLGHVRFNDRTGPNGEKILHIEELQSDWGQKGRSTGFAERGKNRIEEYNRKLSEHHEQKVQLRRQIADSLIEKNDAELALSAAGAHFSDRPDILRRAAAEYHSKEETHDQLVEQIDALDREDDALRAQVQAEYKKVPDMPFKKTWPELLLKRMVRYAADHGYDGVSWTPGEQQAERYDLSKQIDQLHVFSRSDGTYDLNAKVQGEGSRDIGDHIPAEKLPDYVGKEMAQKIVNGEDGKAAPGLAKWKSSTGEGEWKTYSGLDLKVGGAGMHGFYDQIIPAAANKIGKPWGAKVGETQISSAEKGPGRYAVRDRAGVDYASSDDRNEVRRMLDSYKEQYPNRGFDIFDRGKPTVKRTTVPYLPIPPEMRAAGPQPLFRLVYKTPAAEPAELAQARTEFADAERELEKMPPPAPPADLSNPLEKLAWQAKEIRWRIQAEPLLDRYKAAQSRFHYLRNKAIGQVRTRPDGMPVVYLSRHGLRTLHAGLGGRIDPKIDLMGALLSPEDAGKVIQNLDILKPDFYRELQNLLSAGTDRGGRVTVAAVPEKGASLRQQVGLLREELTHGWQDRMAGVVENHLPKESFKALDDAIPESMRDYLRRYGYDMEQSERGSRTRVIETTAKLMSFSPDEFGLSEDEAAVYLFQYFDALEKAHGPGALEGLVHTSLLGKQIKEDFAYARGTEPGGTEAAAGGSGEDHGAVEGVQERGSVGNQGDSPSAEPGVSPGTGEQPGIEEVDAATNSEGEPPPGIIPAGALFNLAPGTPKFKEWFGKSRVVDDAGEPLEVHHQTWNEIKGDFDRLWAANYFKRDPENLDTMGIWFSDHPNLGKYGPRNVDAHLKIENPMVLEDGPGGREDSAFMRLHKMTKLLGGSTKLREKLKKDGFDGVLFKNSHIDIDKANTWVVFEPDQINIVRQTITKPEQVKQNEEARAKNEAARAAKLAAAGTETKTVGVNADAGKVVDIMEAAKKRNPMGAGANAPAAPMPIKSIAQLRKETAERRASQAGIVK